MVNQPFSKVCDGKLEIHCWLHVLVQEGGTQSAGWYGLNLHRVLVHMIFGRRVNRAEGRRARIQAYLDKGLVMGSQTFKLEGNLIGNLTHEVLSVAAAEVEVFDTFYRVGYGSSR